MKILWEESDICNGRLIGRYNTRERWVIGHIDSDANKTLCVLISLDTGRVEDYENERSLVVALNACDYLPIELRNQHCTTMKPVNPQETTP